jgi:hypothetical protein
LVCGPAVRHGGDLQDLRGELQKPSPPGRHRQRSQGDRQPRAGLYGPMTMSHDSDLSHLLSFPPEYCRPLAVLRSRRRKRRAGRDILSRW